MNNYKFSIFTLLAFLFVFNIGAQTNQEEEKLSLNSGTIDKQFEFVIKRSNNYQEYKVVKKNWLNVLKAHTLDSLKAVHKDLSDTQTIVDNQAKEISDLKSNLDTTKNTLTKTNDEKNNMALFGLQLGKAKYNILMWSIIAGLLALLLFFVFKFKNSNSLTKQAKKALNEIEEEFEEHRKVALEREQKVRRQLQDELNKQKPSN